MKNVTTKTKPRRGEHRTPATYKVISKALF